MQVDSGVARTEYEMNGQGGLDQLLAALDGGFQGLGESEAETGLTKIVLARRSDVKFSGKLDPLAVLEALQVRPCSKAMRLQLSDSKNADTANNSISMPLCLLIASVTCSAGNVKTCQHCKWCVQHLQRANKQLLTFT